MAGSQQSFESRLTRFENGVTLLGSWADYTPGNALIKVANLNTFITSVKTANTGVGNALVLLGEKQDDRMMKSFTIPKGVNPDCLENRILGVRNYLEGEDFPKATIRLVDRIISKIRPEYPRKSDPPAPPPEHKHPSPSEKSFAALIANGHAIINLTTSLGVAYNPPDPKLSVANLTALVNDIAQLAKDIQLALDDYGTKNRVRKELYDGPTGLAERTKMIKKYCASFAGLKKSNHFVEFDGAIKGT